MAIGNPGGDKAARKIKFYEYTTIDDGAGGELPNQRVLALETFATIKPVRSDLRLQVHKLEYGTAYEVEIRARSGFFPKKTYELEDMHGRIMLIVGMPTDSKKRGRITFIAQYKG